ncbi:hypothetical protein BJ912DRAFT_678905 [Pholiota molesta]|nr:hypothetical protein BJ912DRAFT_678905 [Pholiota molesta]
MEGEIPWQRESTVGQPQGHITDGNSIGNAMFNGNMAIYGGRFVQNNVARRDKDGFTLLRERVASSAFHNSAERIDPARCHPETRVDVMRLIYNWLVQQGPRIRWLLWLNGAAGAGKSAIMQSIAERCVLAAIAIASFFFSRADFTRNNMAPFVATLVYQLIQTIPETSDDIILTIERNPLIFGQSLESQLQQLLIQPLLRLPEHLRRLLVVFIDGLDECDDHAHQSNLLRVLGNISSGRNIPVIFLIASRREPQIEAEFCQDQVADNLRTIPLDDIQASDDIRRYLNAKFKEIKATHLRRSFLSPDWPSSAVIEQIVRNSSGQFIYASVVIGNISLPHAHPAIQLEIINGIRPRNPSENLFAHLDALYQHIFSRVKQLDTVQNVLAFHLIDSSFSRSCTIESLMSLFQLSAGKLEVLFADLTALVECSVHNHQPLKILHASLSDFLLDESRSGDYYINLDEYRTNLLSLFLERPCHPIPDPHSSTPNLKQESDLNSEEHSRLWAMKNLLKGAKASDRLQRACMNFNYILYSADRARAYLPFISGLLNGLKKLDFEDQGQVYRHVLGVFAAEFAKYWSPHHQDYLHDFHKEIIKREIPDLAACTNQLIRQDNFQL